MTKVERREAPAHWRATEHQLLRAICEGELFRPVASPRSTEASMTPSVRGDDLAAMLAGRYGPPSYRGFAALGLRVTNAFELIDARLPPLRFVSCTFEGRFAIVESHLPRLTLVGCDLADGLSLRASTMTGRFTSRSVRVGGTTDLGGADIGDISVVATTFAPHSGLALDGRNVNVRQDARFTGRCRATATIDLTGAWIGGTLSWASAGITPPAGDALRLSLATVGNNLFLDNHFTARGPVDLEGATIAGRVCFSTAELAPMSGEALRAQSIDVGRDLSLDDNFHATGTIDLTNGRVGSLLSLQHATLEPASPPALRAHNLHVTDAAFNRAFESSDVVELDGAQITGGLAFTDARLSAPDGVVLRAQRIAVSHNARLDGRLNTTGTIDLTGAQIEGDLDFAGAKLRPVAGPALSASNLRVGQELRLIDGFVTHGELRLTRATVEGAMVVEQATLKPPPETDAVDLGDAELRSLRWNPTTVTGVTSLAGASIGALDDTPDAWMGYPYDLGGLNVSRLSGSGTQWEGGERVAWLTSAQRRDHSTRQIEQFAELTDEHGGRDAAIELRRVGAKIEQNDARHAAPVAPRWAAPVLWLALLALAVIAGIVLMQVYGTEFWTLGTSGND